MCDLSLQWDRESHLLLTDGTQKSLVMNKERNLAHLSDI